MSKTESYFAPQNNSMEQISENEILIQMLQVLKDLRDNGIKIQQQSNSQDQSCSYQANVSENDKLVVRLCEKLKVQQPEEIFEHIEKLQSEIDSKNKLEEALKEALRVDKIEIDEIKEKIGDIRKEVSQTQKTLADLQDVLKEGYGVDETDSKKIKSKIEEDKEMIKSLKKMIENIIMALKQIFENETNQNGLLDKLKGLEVEMQQLQLEKHDLEALCEKLESKLEKMKSDETKLQDIEDAIKKSLNIGEANAENIEIEIKKKNQQIDDLEKKEKMLRAIEKELGVEGDEQEIQKEVKALKSNKEELESLKKSFYFDLYKQYKDTISEDFRIKNFQARINDKTHASFVQGMTENTLNALYDNIKKQITEKKEIDSNIEKLIAFFDAMFECIKQEGWERFDPRVGELHNPKSEDGIGVAQGKIEKVFLQGYQTSEKNLKKSIVKVV